MWLFGFLFAWCVVSVWWIEKDVRTICEDLNYLVDLIDQNPDLAKKEADQTQSTNKESDQIRSRKDLYN